MKQIGICMTSLGEENFGIKKDLVSWVSQFGDPIIINPVERMQVFKSILGMLDGFVLGGGADIDSKRYGEPPSFFASRPDIFLEYFDVNYLPILLNMRIPIFGICRGLQTLNVSFGGSLYQHIDHPYSNHDDDLAHEVFDTKDNKKPLFKVNSFHHQAINRVGNELKVQLLSKDNYIEAISCLDRKIFAVQWHPERMYDQYSADAFNLILNQ